MTSFSALLSSFVEQKHIQIHPLTLYCNVDRSTMYKYINGKRLPPRQELVERIADYMRLSPSEHEELMTAWMIAQVGEEAYYNRKNVENFILHFPDVSKIDPVPISASAGTPDRGIPADCQALASQTAVNSAGSRMILSEARKEDGRLALLLQPDNEYLFHFLTSLGESECSLSIEQILCLNNSGHLNKSNQSLNLLYLQAVLPLYIRTLNYNVYYYYDSVESHFSSFNGLPCLILTSEAAVACTSDYRTGIFYSQSETVQLLWELFRGYKEKCSLLFHPVSSIVDELNMLRALGKSSEINYAIQPEPCLVPFLTPDLVKKYVRQDLPDHDELVSLLIDFLAYQKQGILSQRFHVYHTLEGIRSFLDTGKLYEIPEGLYHPFSPEDRRLLVSRMLENPTKNYRLLRGPLQFLPHNFHLYVSPSGGYLLFTNRLNQTVYLLFEEQSLLALFLDYLNHIDVKYLYSCEQMQNLVKNQLFFRT